MKDASALDKNFANTKSVQKEGMTYYNAEELDVYGVTYIDGVYRRMPYEIAQKVSENVAAISLECAGGRVRFSTDSPCIAIYVKYRSVAKVPNYSFTATLGFDLYAGKRYVGCFVPSMDTLHDLEGILDVNSENTLQEYTLNFPVCSEIAELYIGAKNAGKGEGYRFGGQRSPWGYRFCEHSQVCRRCVERIYLIRDIKHEKGAGNFLRFSYLKQIIG